MSASRIFGALRLWQKFSLLGILGAALCAVPLALYVAESDKGIAAAEAERAGVPLVRAALALQVLTHRHGELAARELAGDVGAAAGRRQAAREVDGAMATLDKLIPAGDARLTEHWQQRFGQEWRTLNTALESGALRAPALTEAHRRLMIRAAETVELLADTTGLSLDPEAAGYFTVISSTVNVPRAIADLSALQGLMLQAGGARADGASTLAQAAAFEVGMQRLESGYAKVFANLGAGADDALTTRTEALKTDLDSATTLARSALEDTRRPAAAPAGESAGAARIATSMAALDQLARNSFDVLQDTLDARIAAAQADQNRLLAGVGLTVLLACGLGLLLVRSVTVPLARAVQTARAVQAGDLEQPIEVQGRDETAGLLRTLAEMQRSLKDRNAADAAKLAETTRLQQALQACSTSMMIADAEGVIIYCNPAAMRLLGGWSPRSARSCPASKPSAWSAAISTSSTATPHTNVTCWPRWKANTRHA